MSFQRPSDPAEARTVMQTVYDRYVVGTDRYPRARLTCDPDSLPRKSRQIGRLLHRAWSGIDEDNSYFEFATEFMINVDTVIDPKANSNSVVVTRIGRNAVRYAHLQATEAGRPMLYLGHFGLSEFVQSFEGLDLQLADGRAIVLRNGEVRGLPDAVVARRNNVSGVYLSGPSQPQMVDVPESALL